MKRAMTAVAALAVAGGLVSGAALARPSATPVLKGSVGPGYTISLTMNGKKFTSLKAGPYKFVISDKSSIHNFTLEREKGGKFEKNLTGVSSTGTKTTTLTLGKGKWKFYCKVHEPMMFGFFTVK